MKILLVLWIFFSNQVFSAIELPKSALVDISFTPMQYQGDKPTCWISVYSNLLEYHLSAHYKNRIDISENWIFYNYLNENVKDLSDIKTAPYKMKNKKDSNFVFNEIVNKKGILSKKQFSGAEVLTKDFNVKLSGNLKNKKKQIDQLFKFSSKEKEKLIKIANANKKKYSFKFEVLALKRKDLYALKYAISKKVPLVLSYKDGPGKHIVLVVGYNDNRKKIFIRDPRRKGDILRDISYEYFSKYVDTLGIGQFTSLK